MLTRDKDISIEGDLGGEKVGMSIDQNSLLHLMAVLSDIYSDIVVAIVRELSTNAIDSHIEAGNKKPIEVTTPTSMNPKLKIQDYGVGMDADDIRNIYSKYGASTKRNSNEYNGTLGIGAKSPLAYGGKTFTVVGVKNGVKTTVVVGYDPRTGGSMEIVDESSTSDSNGVTVVVPVNNRYDHQKFLDAALSFQKYAKFPVLVNGKEKPIIKDIEVLDDQIHLHPREPYDWNLADIFVMGNVAYRIMPGGRPLRLDQTKQVVIYVDMGEIDFTPSREDLNYTSYTKAAIEKYSALYVEKMISGRQDQINKCFCHADAYQKAKSFRNMIKPELRKHATFTYKGLEIPVDPVEFGMTGTTVYASPASGDQLWELNKIPGIEMTPSPTGVIHVLNYTNKTITKFHVEKVKRWCDENKVSFPHDLRFIEEHDEDMLKWFSLDTFVDWDDVKKIKLNLPKKAKKPKQPKPERTWEGTGGEAAGKFYRFVPDKNKEIYYTTRTELNYNRFDPRYVTPLGDADHQVFIITDGTMDKFLELYPKAKPIVNLYRKKLEDYLGSLTDEEKDKLARYNRYDRLNIPVEDVDKILDPMLKEQNDGASSNEAYNRYRAASEWLNKLPYNEYQVYTKRMPGISTNYETLRNKYPLVPRWLDKGTKEAKHALLYVNMIYQMEQGVK